MQWPRILRHAVSAVNREWIVTDVSRLRPQENVLPGKRLEADGAQARGAGFAAAREQPGHATALQILGGSLYQWTENQVRVATHDEPSDVPAKDILSRVNLHQGNGAIARNPHSAGNGEREGGSK